MMIIMIIIQMVEKEGRCEVRQNGCDPSQRYKVMFKPKWSV